MGRLTDFKNQQANVSGGGRMGPIQTGGGDLQSIGGFSLPQPPGAETLQQFSLGALKGAGSTISNLGSIVPTIASKIVEASGFGKEKPFQPIPDKMVTPTNTAQQVGFGAEKAAEYFIPAAAATKAEATVNILSQGIKSPLLAAGARILGKGIVQGVAAGGVNLAQTKDIKSAENTALTAGIIRGGLATIGEGARALKIPERLYSTIFKNSKNDMFNELKANGIASLQQNNPVKFKELVDAGIVRTGMGGQPILNDTLAEKALDAGLRGSIRNMTDAVVSGALDSEHQAQQIASTYQKTISFPEKQFENVLYKVAEDYKNVGFGEFSNEAKRLADTLRTSQGEVSAQDALAIRRLLDKLRLASSFDKPASSLSMTQSNFKTLADAARQRVNAIPGMGQVMEKYSFNLQALEALAREASRRGNSQIVSLIDSIFLGGGLASGNPLPLVTTGIMRRMLISPTGMTTLGNAINKSTLGTVGSGILGNLSSGVQSLRTVPPQTKR